MSRADRFRRLDRAEAQKVGLGASELPAILGLSPYGTASDVWLRKVGLAGFQADNAAMAAGRSLEVPILRMASEASGIRFIHNRQTIAHPRWPEVPLFATPDGFGPRRHVGAEVKLVGHRFSDWTPGVPEYVLAQAHGHMAVIPRLSRVLVAALVGSELRTFMVERDEALEDRMLNEAVTWWYRYVIGEIAPEATTSASAWRLSKATANLDGRQSRLAAPDEQVAGAELLELTRQASAIEDRVDEIRRTLAEAAKDSDIRGVGWSAAWKERQDVSWKGTAIAAGATAEQIEANTRKSASFAFRSTVEKE